MGFDSVFRVLLELFPQVDSRILRAVAFENSKDADVAVSVVLAEVIPSFSGIGSAGSPSNLLIPNGGDFRASNTADGKHNNVGNVGISEEIVIDKQIPSAKPVESSNAEFGNLGLNSNGSGLGTGTSDGHSRVHVNAFAKNVSLPEGHQVRSIEAGPEDALLNNADGSMDSSYLDEEEKASLGELVRKNHRSITQVVEVDLSPGEIISPHIPESSSQLVCEPGSPATKVGELEADVPSFIVLGEDVPFGYLVDCEIVDVMNRVSEILSEDLENEEPNGKKGRFTSEVDGFEDESSMKATVISRSDQMCTIELLGDVIENEKTEKIALRSAKDSVFSLISEVEIKEKLVEKAREEAAQGGLDTLTRAEDLKKMLQRAKETNDMHAGEVYGEKAILATETRELQSRLKSLSEERVKGLAILDEIRQALEVRLVSAEEEIKEAESEKLNKEESALRILAHEESNMEKVVQESKILEQQAEENSKLREFLVDRGRLVDMLQGEISVICQDVTALKSKFDQGIPLSKSLSSSQTSSISTSSSSSVVGASFEKVPEVVVSPDNKKESLSDSNDDQLFHRDEVPSAGKKIVEGDEWNLVFRKFRI
ncbi:uncharacterized protein LOC108223359 isoform X1 [Daucus carota subsp. sativus]|uniref:uncharacterized protein LOC108223359 isoform X1 n=2 Tax=Daucus carota subsp. sativus TaxID=79200 RepID=UPI0007B27AA2|nr:PREDICTED: uncharacterized protein LOC108223359 isoform X1 [Daucus carota subsp. sativus]